MAYILVIMKAFELKFPLKFNFIACYIPGTEIQLSFYNFSKKNFKFLSKATFYKM